MNNNRQTPLLWGFAFVAALVATPLQAQDASAFGYSVLGVVPSSGTVESPSETAGTLTSTDLRTTNGVRFQIFEFSGERGTPFSIDVLSDDFDSYLFVIGPGYPEPITDDDTGGACNARLTVFLPGTGVYRIGVGSLSGETGEFTLRVDNREHAQLQGNCGGGSDYAEAIAALESQGFVNVGEEVEGDLLIDGPGLDNVPGAAWDIVGTPGQTVFIDLISDEFDAVVYVTGPDVAGYMSDDDSGGACNSRLRLTFGSDEPYRIVASALSEGMGGLYRLRVSEEEQPLATDSCY